MSTEKRDSLHNPKASGQLEKAMPPSPWARYWAREGRMPQDSHLVSFGQRVTYTFAVGNDVASIHYDQGRGKLFYKGHRITADNMEPWLVDLLHHFKSVLAKSEFAERFAEGYSTLLDRMNVQKRGG